MESTVDTREETVSVQVIQFGNAAPGAGYYTTCEGYCEEIFSGDGSNVDIHCAGEEMLNQGFDVYATCPDAPQNPAECVHCVILVNATYEACKAAVEGCRM